MKITRTLLAALAIALFSAGCSMTDITAPEAPSEVQRGQFGSGMG